MITGEQEEEAVIWGKIVEDHCRGVRVCAHCIFGVSFCVRDNRSYLLHSEQQESILKVTQYALSNFSFPSVLYICSCIYKRS